MDKELIEHIATQLQNHEEAYSEGAWERFSEKKRRRGIAYWPMWAAAMLVLTAGALFFTLNKGTDSNNLVKVQPQKQPSEQTEAGSNTTQQSAMAQSIKPTTPAQANLNPSQTQVEGKDNTLYHNTPLTNTTLSGYPANAELIPASVLNDRQLAVQQHNPALTSFTERNFELAVDHKKPKPVKMTFEDLLAQDSKVNQMATTTKNNQNSKWQPGVYVAPSMGNDNKLNMNYGFSLSYAIANKVSISSGVSYSSISSKEVLGADAPQTLSGRNLESVNARVEGINVPLELKYNISDKLYTGIGVSALAVTNNRQENTYISNQVQNAAALNSATGSYDAKTLIVAERKVEPQPEAAIGPDRYIGFYNFSFGYKQKLSPKKNIAVEPFLRVPMKTFSKENLNLTNGGLRIKVDF